MPRIRKKTSNRASTNDRAKLRHKISDGRKKNRKLAKKNTQWKSRVPKDPGIPNNLPFKDQILAEIAEQRRQAAEEKETRKPSKKPSKTAPSPGVDSSRGDDDESDNGESSIGVKTIRTGQAVVAAKKKTATMEPAVDDDEEEPLLMDPSITDLGSALEAADIWLYVLDARDPLAHRSAYIESLANEKSKKIVFLLNKIDAAPRESIIAWLAHLRRDHPTFPFRVASAQLPPLEDDAKGKSKLSEDDAIGSQAIVKYLESYEPASSAITVAVVGIPNSGKSSVVNSICGTSRLPTYKPDATKTSTTTTYPQPVSFLTSSNKTIRFIDTPGLEAIQSETSNQPSQSSDLTDTAAVSDTLLRSRGRIEKTKRPELAVQYIVSRANAEDLILHYNTSAFNASDPNSFLSGHARVTGRLKRGGVLDLTDSARSVLRDWRVGKFPFYTLPPTTVGITPTSSPSLDYAEVDNAITSSLRSRKDFRMSGGLIRLTSGSIDTRPARLDAPPPVIEHELALSGSPQKADLDEESGDNDEDEDEEMDEDENDDEVDDDDQSESTTSSQPSPPPAPISKRKREQELSSSTNRKRVVVKEGKRTAIPARRVTWAASDELRTFEPTPKGEPKPRASPMTNKNSQKESLKAKATPVRGSARTTQKNQKTSLSAASTDVGQTEAYDFKQFF